MKIKYGALLACMVMAVMLVLGPATTAQAAEARVTTDSETEISLRSIFSAAYYAEKNPDVVAVLGDDPDVLYDHFEKYGIAEGRDVSPIVDLKAYRNGNPDLIEAYGYDWRGILEQFVTEGIYQMAEGTRPSTGVRFNPVTYLNAHPDAASLTNGNLLKTIELFISEGMPAGIWADDSITGGSEDTSIKAVETILSKDTTLMDNSLMSSPIVFEPSVENDVFVSDVNTVDKNSGQTGGETDNKPIKPDPVEPKPTPTCNHLEVLCGNTCNVCNQVIGHYFGESGTEPYCVKCNADFVQVQGCPHAEWFGGTCKLCWKVDSYYTFHDTMHVDETCPDCGYVGTVKYEADKCPGHDYGDGDSCKLCGAAKPKDELPADDVLDEDEETQGEEDAVLSMLKEDDATVADAAVVEDKDAILDEEAVVEDEVAAEEEDVADVEETVEVVDTDTENEPEVAVDEDTDDEDAAVADESVESTDSTGTGNVEVGGAEVIEFTAPADGAADAEDIVDAAAEAA